MNKRTYYPSGKMFTFQYTWMHIYVLSETRHGKMIAVFNTKMLKK